MLGQNRTVEARLSSEYFTIKLRATCNSLVPQLDKVAISSTVFWTLIAYFLFYFLVRFYLLPRILKNIKFRNLKISELSHSNENYFLDELNKKNVYLIHKISQFIILCIYIIALLFLLLKLALFLNLYVDELSADLLFGVDERFVCLFSYFLIELLDLSCLGTTERLVFLMTKVKGSLFSLDSFFLNIDTNSLAGLLHFNKAKFNTTFFN